MRQLAISYERLGIRMRIFLSVFFLFFMACAARPIKTETGLKQEEFWQDQKERREFLVQLDGKAKVRLEEKGRSVSGNGRIMMPSTQTIKLELRDIFGRLHFSAYKNKNAFTAYFPYQKVAYTDTEGGLRYLFEKLKISLSFDQVMDLWLGRLPEKMTRLPFQSWNWDATEGDYIGKVTSENLEFECHVDGDLGVLKKLIWLKPSPQFQVIYDDIGECCGEKKSNEKVDLAYSAKLEVLEGKEKVEVDWEDLNTGVKLPRIHDIELPKETEKVLLNR